MTAGASRCLVHVRHGTGGPAVIVARALLTGALIIVGLLPLPASAQTPSSTVVIVGRVVDAVSLQPVAGALVLSADSSQNVFADSLGNFAIPLSSSPPYIVLAEQFGYGLTTFELPESAPTIRSVLALQPTPMEVEGITVVGESEFTQLVRKLERRRRSYAGSLRVYDVDRLLREGPGTAMDLLRRRFPGTRECFDSWDLCRRVRGQERPILACIDDMVSWGPLNDLNNIPMEELFLVEFYGPTMAVGLSSRAPTFQGGGPRRGVGSAGQVRVYTRSGILSRMARNGRGVWPVEFGC